MKLRQEHKEIVREIAERITAGEDPAAAIRTVVSGTGLGMMKAAQIFRKQYGCGPYDYRSGE